MVFQNYQNLIEMTLNIIDIDAFGVGIKCPRKIHLNTQCPPPFLGHNNSYIGGVRGRGMISRREH